jgi:Ca-activated chloride channel family protein
MRLRLPISLSLLLVSWQNADAQLAPAEDFFHSGAQMYISNNVPQAKQIVEMGRKLYPDDDKLKKLEELLKQQSQQQQSPQNQQQNQQDQSQQQKSNEQKNQQQPSSADQQKADEQKQAEQKKGEPDKATEQKKPGEEKKAGKKSEDKNAEGQPVKPGEMTPEEAKRLLDAQKGNEQFLQLKPTDKPRESRRPVKDW